MNGTILVGTAGQGILRSADDGTTWHRLGTKEAIEFDGTVRALAVDPHNPARVLAGADAGICLSTDGGAHFVRIDSPVNGQTVWSLAFHPLQPQWVIAGTGAPSRARMFRSRDGGNHWESLGVELPEFCAGVNRPRILTVAFHPNRANEVWFGVEEGGAWRSRDAGDTWQRVDTPEDTAIRGINNSDIHAIAILPATDDAPAKHLVVTVNSVCESVDDAHSFIHTASKDRFDGLYYTRTVQPLDETGQQLLLAVGDGTPGARTRIYRSADRGATWQAALLHTAPNSTVWTFGTHPSDRRLVFAGTKYGHLLRSTNGGHSWHKEWREFSEITAVVWTPFVAPVRAHAQSIN